MRRSRPAWMWLVGLLALSLAVAASGSYRHYRSLHDRLQVA